MSEILDPGKLSKEAKSAYQRGNFEAAARLYLSASEGLSRQSKDLDAAEMRNNASVAYLQAKNSQAAFDAVEGTPEIFAAGNDPRRQATALGNLAAALEGLNRPEEAMEAYQQSADLFQQIGEAEMRASVMQSLSALQLRTGRQLQALATMNAGLEGVKHPSPRQRFLKKLLNIPFKMLER
jgi:tetratricopeptide (TPR) repeat protein